MGWSGFDVTSAQTTDKISGLVAVNSLMAMVGGTHAARVAGRNDPGFVHDGPLAGLVAGLRGAGPDAPARCARRRRGRGGSGSWSSSPGRRTAREPCGATDRHRVLGIKRVLFGGFVVHGALKAAMGLRLSQQQEYDGADLSIHKASSTPEREVSW